MEDLLPFSDEALVRAVFACSIPVVSAIGHETDHTLLGLVADHRAPTPTAAAEMVTPDRYELLERLAGMEGRSVQYIQRYIREKQAYLSSMYLSEHRLIEAKWLRLDEVMSRITSSLTLKLTRQGAYVQRYALEHYARQWSGHDDQQPNPRVYDLFHGQ